MDRGASVATQRKSGELTTHVTVDTTWDEAAESWDIAFESPSTSAFKAATAAAAASFDGPEIFGSAASA